MNPEIKAAAMCGWPLNPSSAETENESSYTCTQLHAAKACKGTNLPLVYTVYLVVVTEFLTR